MTRDVRSDSCPCGSTRKFKHCCAPLLAGERRADSAQQLMRSRYTAYVMRDASYLRATWHPDTRPAELHLDEEPVARWIGLKILDSSAGQSDDTTGTVEFVARYKINGRALRLHEVSRFRRQQGLWFYVDGTLRQ